MTITVQCPCGTRVRGDEARLRRKVPCPECGDTLPAQPEPKEKKISFGCLCGLKLELPASRGGLWFDCPQCGRQTVIPGFGSAKKKAFPIDLPPEESFESAGSGLLRLVLVAAALAAAIAAAVMFT